MTAVYLLLAICLALNLAALMLLFIVQRQLHDLSISQAGLTSYQTAARAATPKVKRPSLPPRQTKGTTGHKVQDQEKLVDITELPWEEAMKAVEDING